MLNRELQSYTNKEEYHKLLQKYINYINSDNIFESIKSVSNILQDMRGHLNNVKSDSAYWGVMSEVCLYEDLQTSLIYLYYQSLKEFECKKMKPYFEAKDLLDNAKAKKDQMIKDLLKYKPSGYKAKIELLEEVFKNE